MTPLSSDTTLQEKLGIRAGIRIDLINAPAEYAASLKGLTAGEQRFEEGDELDLIQIFATDRQQLTALFAQAKKRLANNGMLWVSWPKQSSSAAGELRDSIVREVGLGQGMVDVKVIAIDDQWSALKFVHRSEARRLDMRQAGGG